MKVPKIPKLSVRSTGFNGVNAINTKPPSIERGSSKGWTQATARRNKIFLQSVVSAQIIHLQGFAFTLTFREIPETPRILAKLIDNLTKFLARNGVEHYHWVIEWTRKGIPHIHGVAFAQNDKLPPCPTRHDLQTANQYQWDPLGIKKYWVKSTPKYDTLHRSQFVTPVYGIDGWFKYVSKHASRGLDHFQRQRDSLPISWQGQTGRMWGKSRDWPLRADDFDISRKAFFQIRRWVKGFLKSSAQTELRRVKNHNLNWSKAKAWALAATGEKAKSDFVYRIKDELRARRGVVRTRKLFNVGRRDLSEIKVIPVCHSCDAQALMGPWLAVLSAQHPLAVAPWAAPSTPESKRLSRARLMHGL